MGGKNRLKNTSFYQVLRSGKGRFANLEKGSFFGEFWNKKSTKKAEEKKRWKTISNHRKHKTVTG